MEGDAIEELKLAEGPTAEVVLDREVRQETIEDGRLVRARTAGTSNGQR